MTAEELSPEARDALLKIKAVYHSSPVLQRLHLLRRQIHEGEIKPKSQKNEVAALIRMMAELHGLKVQFVKENEVQNRAGARNYATINIEPGVLHIEEQLARKPLAFVIDLAHEFGYHLLRQKYGEQPAFMINGKLKHWTHAMDERLWEKHDL
ncbi:MAG: hypothetical protein V1835_06660 [Candidatus Micrarchaeota archaeon]